MNVCSRPKADSALHALARRITGVDPSSEGFQDCPKLARSTCPVELVALGPASPPLGIVVIVVLDRFKDSPVAISPVEVDFQTPAGVIYRADLRAEAMLPVAVTLRFIPALKPIKDIHRSLVVACRHAAKRMSAYHPFRTFGRMPASTHYGHSAMVRG